MAATDAQPQPPHAAPSEPFEPVLVNRAERPGLAETLRELWRYRELVKELSKRALMLRYKNSVLGIAWSLATPLVLIALITIMNKLVLRLGIANYSAYLFPVMFAWAFYAAALPDMCIALLENRSFVKKVSFPRELLPITVLMANLFHLGIALVLTMVYLIIQGIVPQQVNVEVLLLLLIVPAHAAFTLGLGFMLCAANTLFEDIKYLVVTLMQMLLYAVPVIYPIEKVAQAVTDWGKPWLLDLYLLNPFASALVLYQKALLPPIQIEGTQALPWSWGLLGQFWVVAFGTLGVGLLVFNRYKWQAVERL